MATLNEQLKELNEAKIELFNEIIRALRVDIFVCWLANKLRWDK